MEKDSRIEPIDLNALPSRPRAQSSPPPARRRAPEPTTRSGRHSQKGTGKRSAQSAQRQPAQRRDGRGASPPPSRRAEPDVYDFQYQKKDAARRARIRRNRLLLAGAVLFIVLAVIGIRMGLILGSGLNTFYEGVSVDGLKLHGYTREEAVQNLTDLNQRRLQAMSMTFSYGEREWTISPEQISASLDIEAQVEAAWEKGRNGNIFARQSEIGTLKRTPYNATTTLSYDTDALLSRLSTIKTEVDLPAKDASMDFDTSRESMFIIEPEEPGREVILDDILTQAKAYLEGGIPGPIEIKPIAVDPTIYANDLRNSTNRIKRVTTPLGSSSAERIHNIKLALSKFDGMIIMQGEEVSFNEVTGPRGLEDGYETATVILDDDFVDGPGGGVCQVSTTLYQALVQAGVDIVKREKHSLPVSYIELKGTDAAVAYDYKDLVFKNNTGAPIYLECRVASGSNVSVTVYGRALEEGIEIKFLSEVLEEIPAPQPEILPDTTGEYVKYTDETFEKKKSRGGWKIRTYAVTYKNGEEIERKQLTNDHYRAVTGTTYVGVTPRPVTAPVATIPEIVDE